MVTSLALLTRDAQTLSTEPADAVSTSAVLMVCTAYYLGRFIKSNPVYTNHLLGEPGVAKPV